MAESLAKAVKGSLPEQQQPNQKGKHGAPLDCLSRYHHSNYGPGYHQVVLGEFDMDSSEEQVQIKSVSQVITHSYWNPYNMNYDCTLLRLSSPANINYYISPIRLVAFNAYIPGGTICTTTGWGWTVPGGATSSKLMQTNIPIIDSQNCQQYWGNQISDIMICAGASGSSSCCESLDYVKRLSGLHCEVYNTFIL
ncbi:chymotrypsin-like protease CTRL-1 [Rhincodon typus]|uniref:chymotrypsin-like protease CTRL-1 n=1 Tax=Rhincodon typus TaxID=259920 RepID=UPI00202FFD97|nr:chymotrypsin-like protease CTRL-1 [Rhincodon typus]